MTIATKYNAEVAWRTIARGVFQITRATITEGVITPATYGISISAIDSNEPGAGTIEAGYYLIDNWGTPYRFTTASIISDDFNTGRCPMSGLMAIVYKSSFKGRSLYLSPDSFRHLHNKAWSNYQPYANALLWANNPNAKKITFTTTQTPGVTGFQGNQLDGYNLAEDYGELPKIQLFTTGENGTILERQEVAIYSYINGLIDSIMFDLSQPETGYIIISK